MKISLKTKILAIMLVVGFIPGLVGVLSTYTKGTEVFRNATTHYLTHEAAGIVFGVRTLIEKEVSEGMLLASHPAVRALAKSPAGTYLELKETVTQFFNLEEDKLGHANISLYDRRGQILLQLGAPAGQTQDRLDTLKLLEGNGHGGMVAPPVKGRNGAGYYIPLYIPVLEKRDGALLGAIAIYLEIADFFTADYFHKPGELAHFNLVMDDGRVIYDPLVSYEQPPIAAHIMERIRVDGTSWLIEQDEHGLESVFAYAPLVFEDEQKIRYSERRPLYVLFTAPVSEAFDRPVQSVLFSAAIPGFLFASLLIFIIYGALQKTLNPIARLKQGAGIIGGGDLDHRIHIRTGDEIEELAEEFNKMTAQLQSSYQDLEKKVQERTLELQESNRQLEKAHRVKSRFLASMSHELRTPLNAILGFSEVLADGSFGAVNEKQKKYLSNIHNSGKHLLEVINDILDLSKIEAGRMILNPSEFSVQDAMDEIHALVAQLAQNKEVELSFFSTSAPNTVVADKVRFRQIMLNLLSNAIKFTPGGGSVQVTAEQDGLFLKVAVTDTGIGIDTTDLEDIFESFRQVDSSSARNYEGTGLGLALVKHFVEMHGGNIVVASELNKGSTFTFRIPIVGPEPGASSI